MTTTTPTLASWLLAQYDAQEALARAAVGIAETYNGTPYEAATWIEGLSRSELVAAMALGFACPTCHQPAGECCVSMTPPHHAPKPATSLHGQRTDLARVEVRRRGMDAHIATHDPAYVLADVAAKRQIVEMHEARVFRERDFLYIDDDHFEQFTDEVICAACGTIASVEHPWGRFGDMEPPEPEDPCLTLRALAAPFAGREGWREEWA